MTGRRRLLLLATAVLWPACASVEPPSPLRPRPNILFIMADDHATAAVSCYGSRLVATPSIDRLAREGMRFDRTFCTNGICAPSRAVILTGKLSHRNGVLDNTQVFDPSQPTLPKLLGAAGYQSAVIGKWHLKSQPVGFDHWEVLVDQGHYYNPDFLTVNGRVRREGYVTDIVTDRALDWLDRRDAKRPFFLMLHHKAPHRNWMPALRHLEGPMSDVPEPATLFDDYRTRSPAAREQELSIHADMTLASDLKYGDRRGITRRLLPEQRRRFEAWYAAEDEARPRPAEPAAERRWRYQRYMKDYLRCVTAVDESVGRVLDGLRDRGLDRDTVVIYTSDQGFFLGEHGWFDKRFIYEESLRMPFVVRHPGGVPPGRTSAEIITNLDFAPTLLDLAGVDTPDEMQGRSFRDLLEGEGRGGAPRDAAYYHYFEYPAIHAVKRHYGIRTRRHKLVHFYHDIDAWELYDLERDPAEVNNVADDPAYAGVRRDLERRLRELQVRYDDRPEVFRASLEPWRVAHAAMGQRVAWSTPPATKYAAADVTDGTVRVRTLYSGRHLVDWLGFREAPAVGTMTFDVPRAVSGVQVHVLHDPGVWIHRPVRVELWVSRDGERFERVDAVEPDGDAVRPASEFVALSVKDAGPWTAIRVVLTGREEIPAGLPGAGEKAWVFVDEIAVR